MKKFLFIILPFLFLGCSSAFMDGYFNGNWDYEVINNTAKTLSFTCEDKEYTLDPSDSVVIHKNNKSEIIFNEHRIEIKQDFHNSKGTYTVSDILGYPISIFNSSEYDIILSENNGMLGPNYNDTVLISAGDTVSSIIFTMQPKYQAVFYTNGFPADMSFLSIKANLF